MAQQTRTQSMLHFLAPSAGGLVTYVVLYIVIILGPVIPGAQSIVRSAGQLHGTWIYTVGHALNNALSLNIVGRGVLFIFWFFAGLCLLLAARLASTEVGQLSEAVGERDYKYVVPIGSDRNQPLREFVEKLVLRFALIVVTIIYLRTAVRVVRNWDRGHQSIGQISLHTVEQYVAMLGVTLVLAHGLTLLLRLLLLRRRVFSTLA